MNNLNTPIVYCVPRTDCPGWKFFCEYCKCWHYHGTGLGGRAAHCVEPSSPYLRAGYVLADARELIHNAPSEAATRSKYRLILNPTRRSANLNEKLEVSI